MLLLDSSAWARLSRPDLSKERRDDVARWLRSGELGTSLPFLLEAGYSARSSEAHAALLDDLRLLPYVELDEQVARLALQTQSELAHVGHHRLPPADVMIAACAHRAGAGILHYDHDYDLIASHSRLRFESVWLAPAGSLT